MAAWFSLLSFVFGVDPASFGGWDMHDPQDGFLDGHAEHE